MPRRSGRNNFADSKTADGLWRPDAEGQKTQLTTPLKAERGVLVSDELIAERRAEAARDDQEARRWLRKRRSNCR
jgi:hypothetical protein